MTEGHFALLANPRESLNVQLLSLLWVLCLAPRPGDVRCSALDALPAVALAKAGSTFDVHSFILTTFNVLSFERLF
jgi:hypothetical protein